MEDCRIMIEVRKGKIDIKADGAGWLELATICGYLENMTGLYALKCGKDLEEVKSSMLDLHLAAMEDMEKGFRKLSE